MRLLLRFTLVFLISLTLTGCDDFLLLDPKGPIGEGIRDLIYLSVFIMLIIIIPVLIMSVWFPYKFRASNKKAEYNPIGNTPHALKRWFGVCLV